MLTAIYPIRFNNRTNWLCKCDCGNEKFILRQTLVAGAKSCGCLTKTNSVLAIKKRAIDNEINRFYDSIEMIPDSGCWLWTGTLNEKGYGRTTSKGIPITTHRWSWIIHNGYIETGKHVLHICDVRSCCNPSHLFIGTHQDNMIDRDKKKNLPWKQIK